MSERFGLANRLSSPASGIISSRSTPATAVRRVTVGMPVYNAAGWLGPAIESIVGQTFGDLELVISDNASTDGSFEIAQGYAHKDERVRLFRNPVNLGVNKNYSLLVGYARSEYFKWASANDLCDRTFIAKCVHVLATRPEVGLCYPRTKLFAVSPEKGTAYDVSVQALHDDPIARFRYVFEHIGLNNAINGLFRMSVLRTTGLIRPHYSSDITLVAEVALSSKIVELPEVLFFRRFDHNSATALQDAFSVRQTHFPTPSFAMLFQGWRRCWGYVSAVTRADLTSSQRMRGLNYVARRWYSAWPELYTDMRDALAELRRVWRRAAR